MALPWGVEHLDLGVRDGRIAELGVPPGAESGDVINARGLHVLPGLIDPHVHLRQPGDASVETISSGTRAAVLGGLAAVFDMPNTSPAITSADLLGWKQDYIAEHAWCDVGLYIGASRTNIGELAPLERARGVCGIKVFAGSSTGDLLIEDDETLERVMRAGRRRISYHSEDEYRFAVPLRSFRSGEPYARHMDWRDEETAFLGTRRLLALARLTGRPAHILHVSTAEELAYMGASPRPRDGRGADQPSHAGGARLLRATRRVCRDDPRSAARATARRPGRRYATARSTRSVPITRRTAGRGRRCRGRSAPPV